MALVTLADRLKIRMPAQPQQAAKPQSTVPAPGASNPQVPKAPKPKAAGAAKVPGVNTKQDGNNSAETFNNAPEAPKTGRPMKDPKQPLMKALTDAQKHKIMTEVNQNLGVRNLASNDPALKQTGLEQQTKYGKPGDPPPPMPTAITQVKKPAKPVSPTSENKTKVERKRGDETAPLTISSNITQPLAVDKTPTGTDVTPVDGNKTGTSGSAPKSAKPARAPSPILNAHRKKEMAKINAEFAYKNIKSKDPDVKRMGEQQMAQTPLKEKARYRGNQVLGILRGAIAKHEQTLTDLKKNELEDTVKDPPKPDLGPKKKKKKDPYSPKIRVTQSYSAPGKFHAGKFLMGVLGHGSPVANRVLSAAKQAVTKSELEDELSSLSKSQVDQHVNLLKRINNGSIDAAGLVALLKKG